MANSIINRTKKIINAISTIYSTMHFFDLKQGICEEIYAFNEVHDAFEKLHNTVDIQTLIHTIIGNITTKEYKKSILEFTSFETLQKRLSGKKILSFDFIGKVHGWTRASFIPLTYDKNGVLTEVIFVTRSIQTDKQREESLLILVDYDELTGLYNRRAFERDVDNIEKTQMNQFLTIVSFDINGLKYINDNFGHAAGDELIVGTADCLKNTFNSNGKIYRIGGDEFAVIIDCNVNQLFEYFGIFDTQTSVWSGKLVKDLTVSKGCAAHAEFPDLSFRELQSKADQRMYQEKNDFYKEKSETNLSIIKSEGILPKILQKTSIGVISIEYEENNSPCLHIDDYIKEFLGLNNGLSPEQIYTEWISRIHPDYRDAVFAGIEKIVIGNQAEMQYPWYHPKAGLLYVRTTGYRDPLYTKGIRINGFFQNISNLIHFQKDELTGFYTKEFFFQKAEEILATNPDKHYRIFVSDIENFKAVNEKYGIESGDRLIKYLAKSLKKMAPDLLLTGRLNADRFVCLQEDTSDSRQNRKTGMSIQYEILNKAPVPNIIWKHGIYYTKFNREISVQVMCDRARQAVESIKGNYEFYCAVYDEKLSEKLNSQQRILENMEDSLKNQEFKVYLQPKFDLHSNRTGGAEALVRWIHPEIGPMNPGEFIPVFEKNGFVKNIDQFVFMEVCRILRKWLDENKTVVPISVNLSRRDFEQKDLAINIINYVNKYEIPHELIHFELTESAFSDNPEFITSILKKLREEGFKIELDDFGAGYSSLTTLSEIDFDVLKLDMSIIKKDNPSSPKNVLDLCSYIVKQMKIISVAEGVETAEQVKRIQEIGCDFIQGYYYSKPISVQEFEEYIGKESLNWK